MKHYFFILSTFLAIACSTPAHKTDPDLGDLNLYTTTDLKIDSVLISDISRKRTFHSVPFKDTLTINIKDSINDVYNIDFYTEKGRIANQLWLDGQKIVIKATLNEKLKIDTVIGSSLYYESLRLTDEIGTLYRERNRTKLIDQFFMQKITEYKDSPLSLRLISRYFYRLQNDREKIKKVVRLLENQPPALKNHPIGKYRALTKLLNTTSIDLKGVDFINLQQKISKLKPVKQGHFYLLDYWFVNCIPCVKDHKIIADDTQFLTSQKIELRGISIDKDHKKWKDYLTKHLYNWPNYREASTGKLSEKLDISMYPTYYLLDDQGGVLFRSNSYVDVKNFVHKYRQ